MSPSDFRTAGHELVDVIADFLDGIADMPVNPDPSPSAVRAALGTTGLPEHSSDPLVVLRDTLETLIADSLHNGHPRFWAYITSSANPVGILGDLMASAMNPNVALWSLSPVATEIELQTIRWIAELIGYPTDCGGVLVSGGNMANFIGFLTARRVKADWPVKARGPHGGPKLVLYVSAEAHTWVDKASELFGLGSDHVRWIGVDHDLRMRVDLLADAIKTDRAAGFMPFMVVGTAGSVSTGAVDPLDQLADLCEHEDLWFHVDGAYGAFAAALPDAQAGMSAIRRADSVALDPHKWLYAPLEAGCTLVRNPGDLERTFGHKPFYLDTDGGTTDERPMLVDRGPQNSRGFRALKVWLGLKTSGREGVVKSISEDMALSRHMAALLSDRADFEVLSQSLSITTFRYLPMGVDRKSEAAYLDRLNELVLHRLQSGGDAYVSHGLVRGCYALRACIVNFRTTASDVEALPDIIARIGHDTHEEIYASFTA